MKKYIIDFALSVSVEVPEKATEQEIIEVALEKLKATWRDLKDYPAQFVSKIEEDNL